MTSTAAHAAAQETVLWGLQRAACYTGGYTGGSVVPEHALDDSAFAPSSRSPSGPSTATAASEAALQPGRYIFQTQDPWCAALRAGSCGAPPACKRHRVSWSLRHTTCLVVV
jgi:hypothetical protein